MNEPMRLLISQIIFFYNSSIRINDLHFYVIDPDRQLQQSNSIGFGYSDVNTNYSIIRRLYDEGKSDRKIFAIGQNGIDDTPLYLGGIPKEILSTFNSKIVIKVDERHNKWGFTLKRFSFDGKEFYNNKDYAYLATNNDRVFAPAEFITYINNKIFAPYYSNRSCTFYSEYGSSYINCNCDALDYFPNMTIYIDIFILDKENSFVTVGLGNICLFLFQQNNHNRNQWLFGFFFTRTTSLLLIQIERKLFSIQMTQLSI